VVEATFQDHAWRPRLAPLREFADLRIVHCVVDVDTAWTRIEHRRKMNPHRRAHADNEWLADHATRHAGFDRVAVDAPHLEVNTTDGYHPALPEVVSFVNGYV
jgi:hypothetical protein